MRALQLSLGFFKEVCCEDIWRYFHPSSSGLTWSRADGSFSCRIDLIGCPFAWVPFVSACDIVPCPFSDHCALAFSVPHGPGLWKLNVSILEEREYFDIISDFWAQWKYRKAVYSSLAKWWEDGKGKIKGLTIFSCCRRSNQASQFRDGLTRLAEHLKGRVDAGCLSCLGRYRSVLEQYLNGISKPPKAPRCVPGCVGWKMDRCRLPSFSVWKRSERLIGGLQPYVNLMTP